MMRSILAFTAAALTAHLAAAAGPGQAAPPRTVRWAIVIGHAAADAGASIEAAQRAAVQVLHKHYGYPQDEKVTIELYGEKATQKAVNDAILSVRRRMGGADTLLAYILLPSIERKGGAYFVPADGREAEVWTLLGHDELEELLGRGKGRASLVILNTCAERSSGGYRPMKQSLGRAAGVSTVTFCDARAGDRGAQRFAKTFATVLQSAANNGRLTDSDLVDRLREGLGGTRVELVRDAPRAEDGFMFVVERRRADALLGELRTADSVDAQRRAVDALAGAGRAATGDETKTKITRGIADVAKDESAPSASRMRAIGALGESGSPGVVPDLAEIATRSTDPELRRAAVDALARVGSPETLKPLQAALADGSGMVRTAAVRGLGRHAHLASAAPVLTALGDAEADVRAAALQMLAILAKPPAGTRNLITPVVTAARKGAQTALRDTSANVRREAVNTLARLGVDVGHNPTLLTLLGTDPDITVRTTIALTLGRENRGRTGTGGSSTVVGALVRAAAMWSLGEIGDVKARPLLSSGLRTPEARIREAAVEALGKLRDRDAVPDIIAILDDEVPKIRAAAARALGTIQDGRASEPLLNRMKTETDPYVRRIVEEALHRLPTPSMLALEAALRDPSPQVRREAVERLGDVTEASAADFVVDRLGDPNANVREAALQVVTRRGAAWRDAIVAGLASPVTAVRVNAAVALGTLGTPEAGAALLTRFSGEPSPLVRAQIAAALGSVPPLPGGETALIGAALEPDPLLRTAAAAALRQYPSVRTQETLLALTADEDADVRERAIRTLRAIAATK